MRHHHDYTDHDFILLYVGYLIPLKRPGFLIELMKDLNPSTKLLILGDGELMSECEHLVRELGLEDRVNLKGQIPNHTIHEYYQLADCHIMASESEGRPNVIYQAMACELPSLATAVGGIPEMIDHCETGYLLAFEKTEYINAIESLESNPNQRLEMGHKAHKKLMSFANDKNTVVTNHLKLYQKLFT